MKKTAVIILSVIMSQALCLMWLCHLWADVVELTTGEKLEGKIIEKDESGITLKVPYGLIIIEQKFVKSIQTDESAEKTDKKKPGGQDKKAKKAELEARKLKTRVERWVKSRNKLICNKCGGDGKNKCSYCKGTGQQYSDQFQKTTRG
jgi:hypothetical protein